MRVRQANFLFLDGVCTGRPEEDAGKVKLWAYTLYPSETAGREFVERFAPRYPQGAFQMLFDLELCMRIRTTSCTIDEVEQADEAARRHMDPRMFGLATYWKRLQRKYIPSLEATFCPIEEEDPILLDEPDARFYFSHNLGAIEDRIVAPGALRGDVYYVDADKLKHCYADYNQAAQQAFGTKLDRGGKNK